jgi:hypothetical protein
MPHFIYYLIPILVLSLHEPFYQNEFFHRVAYDCQLLTRLRLKLHETDLTHVQEVVHPHHTVFLQCYHVFSLVLYKRLRMADD